MLAKVEPILNPPERRNRIENLSLCETLELSLEGIHLLERRLLQISDRIEATDPPLRELLGQTAALAARHDESLRQLMIRIGCSTHPRLNPQEREHLLRRMFPSVLNSFGEGALERDPAIYFVELLHEECGRFQRALAGSAIGGPARAFLLSLAESCRCQVDHLRTVLL